ncbi:MAG TPA: DNA-binding protein [Thermoplasmata archaeon]|jgi:programmed cell death protein 5|nr:DNA-binding protein [Thermoplasmata archaeon]
MDDIEAIRKKKLRELQQQQQQPMFAQDEFEEAQQKEYEEQKKVILRAILMDDARERLGRIKAARPEMAENLENQLIMLAQSGRLKNKINDEQLRELLSKILPKKRDITIRRRGI